MQEAYDLPDRLQDLVREEGLIGPEARQYLLSGPETKLVIQEYLSSGEEAAHFINRLNSPELKHKIALLEDYLNRVYEEKRLHEYVSNLLNPRSHRYDPAFCNSFFPKLRHEPIENPFPAPRNKSAYVAGGSKHKGVHKYGVKWIAQLYRGGVLRHLGSFTSEQEAYEARQKAIEAFEATQDSRI